jgi:hypothetical protein
MIFVLSLVGHWTRRTMLLAVVLDLITSNVPTFGMTDVQISNHLLRKRLVSEFDYELCSCAYHCTIWAGIPLLASGVPLKI